MNKKSLIITNDKNLYQNQSDTLLNVLDKEKNKYFISNSVKHIVHYGEDIRLDRFLKINYNINHSLSCKFIRKGSVKVNNERAFGGNQRVKNNDIIYINEVFYKEILTIINKQKREKSLIKKTVTNIPNSIIEKVKKCIIFENKNIVAINKPSGIASQSGTSVSFSLDKIMNVIYTDQIFPVHRLDKETSGISIFAKNRNAAVVLSKSFAERKIKKTYIAVVKGIPNKLSGIINNPILNKYNLTQDAKTVYKVIKHDNNYSLLGLRPKTGRMHQLRIHCSHNLNLPIVGDKKYCNHKIGKSKDLLSEEFVNSDNFKSRKTPMMLCAYKIKLPENMDSIEIKLPNLPNFFLLKD